MQTTARVGSLFRGYCSWCNHVVVIATIATNVGKREGVKVNAGKIVGFGANILYFGHYLLAENDCNIFGRIAGI